MPHTRRPIFKVFVVIVHGDIPRLMALMLEANRLLAMAKDTSGLRPTAMSEVFL
jgi:hypothetical protein